MCPLQNVPQSGQRYDDAPIIPTKAKMNHALERSTTSDFGTDSMFEKSRYPSLQSRSGFLCPDERTCFRTSRPDEDAPPVTSVNELMNDIPPDSSQSRFRQGVRSTVLFHCRCQADTSQERVCVPPPPSTSVVPIPACTFTTTCVTAANTKIPRAGLPTFICYRFRLSAR